MKPADIQPNGTKRSGEQRLWMNVILQALTDATKPLARPKSLKGRMEIIRAREWFTLPDKDFAGVCELADLNPEAVRAFALRHIDRADADSAVLGLGSGNPVTEVFRIRRKGGRGRVVGGVNRSSSLCAADSVQNLSGVTGNNQKSPAEDQGLCEGKFVRVGNGEARPIDTGAEEQHQPSARKSDSAENLPHVPALPSFHCSAPSSDSLEGRKASSAAQEAVTPGAVADFDQGQGTGPGSIAQDRTKLEFL